MRTPADQDGLPSRARSVRLLQISAGIITVGLTLVYLGTFLHRSSSYSLIDDGILANVLTVLTGVITFTRAALVRDRRPTFVLLGLTSLSYAVGNCSYVFYVQNQDPVPFPSVADLGYLATAPLIIAAVLTLAWPHLRSQSLGTLLDASLGTLSCAAAGSIVILAPLIKSIDGPPMVRIVAGAYPVFDVIQLALIVGILTVRGSRFDWIWLWLTLGVVTFTAADVLFLYNENNFTAGSPLNSLYVVGLTLMALPAILPIRPERRRVVHASQDVMLRNLFSLIGVLILVYGSLIADRLPVYAVVLAIATLLTAAKRASIGFAALRLLALSQRQAKTDELTQLFNRRHFDEQMQRILAGRKVDANLAVLMLDLNGFKAINDNFGHHAGDEVLRQVATRLRHELRENDLLARLGGDEFGLLLPDCDAEDALAVARRMLTGIEQPLLIEGETHNAGGSIGIAVFPDDGVDMALLIQRADTAMYDAKVNRLGVVVFDRERHQSTRKSLNVNTAIEEHELVVHYQPQYELGEGRMTGVEALVRWNHPERGLIYPDVFLSFFEKAGMTAELTLEVLQIALRDHETWRRNGIELHLSINLPPSALLRADLVGSVASLLLRHGAVPDTITLEITESTMMFDVERARRVLDELQALGLQLSLDDYGTGYCSLTYLRDLPLHEIKIDRSFVMNIAPGSPDADIVASTLALAHKRGLRTVAEGVETPAAWSLLRELGCDVAQGYLMARPMPATELLLAPRRVQPGMEQWVEKALSR